MARFGYIAYDMAAEEEREEVASERKALRSGDATPDREIDDRFGQDDPDCPEFADVDTFAEFLADDDREEYTHTELQCVSYRARLSASKVRAALATYGYTLAKRREAPECRTFSSNPHNRYAGNPMAGGGGGGSIMGLAYN